MGLLKLFKRNPKDSIENPVYEKAKLIKDDQIYVLFGDNGIYTFSEVFVGKEKNQSDEQFHIRWSKFTEKLREYEKDYVLSKDIILGYKTFVSPGILPRVAKMTSCITIIIPETNKVGSSYVIYDFENSDMISPSVGRAKYGFYVTLKKLKEIGYYNEFPENLEEEHILKFASSSNLTFKEKDTASLEYEKVKKKLYW